MLIAQNKVYFFYFSGTNLDDWKRNNSLDLDFPLDSYHQALFFEDIQITEYLLLEQCQKSDNSWDTSGKKHTVLLAPDKCFLSLCQHFSGDSTILPLSIALSIEIKLCIL